jgi:transposase-like protein
MATAQAFFRSAKSATGQVPDRVTTDGHGAYPWAIRSTLGQRVVHQPSCLRDDGLEQDQRGTKMGGSDVCAAAKNFTSAAQFCHGYDEPRPANRRRLRHLRRATAVLAILAAGWPELMQ